MPRVNRGKPKPRKKAAPVKKVSDKRLKEALVSNDGMVAAAAREVGLTRQSVHERIRNNMDFAGFVGGLKKDLCDMAQGALAYQMEKNHCRASSEFVLKNLGRDIGYGPQPEIPPPPPDNSRRAIIVNQIFMMLNQQAAAMHAQPALDVTPAPVAALNGHAKPNGAVHGQDPKAQLLAAKKPTNGHGK